MQATIVIVQRNGRINPAVRFPPLAEAQGFPTRVFYEIYQNDRVIEEGTFAIDVAITDVGVFPREAICSDSVQCREEEIVCGRNDDGSRRRGTRERCFTVTDCQCPS
jgi:hypothetical protein